MRVILLLNVIVLKCCYPRFALIDSDGDVGVGFEKPKIALLVGARDIYEKSVFVGGTIQLFVIGPVYARTE